jgi:pSer/pThr/pTyr-binding forkhead associated (FHA) protein
VSGGFSLPNVRIESLALCAGCALALLAALPKRRRSRHDAIAAMQAVVLRVEDYDGTRTVRVPAPITIGRAPLATLIVSDAQVSRVHARIDLSDGVLCVRDLDSRNGTLVNARPIDGPTELRVGDEIDIGTTRIVFGGVGPWK